MKRTSISLQVIMAGKYDFEVGKKVNFRLDPETRLYMVSSEQLEFGLAKSLVRGKREELKSLGSDFSGIVVQSSPEAMCMMVKVFTGDGRGEVQEEHYDTGRTLFGGKPVKKRVWRKLERNCAAPGNKGPDELCWTRSDLVYGISG
ncbi:hypothetical protein [Enterocloster bolteae]|uniref:hypothetical protein n=1 Tax=Enterocloster bolteae TaxID=208479 RepID=UPI0028DB5DA9|nr:hypothetical protein [Enterocloster bolteae]